MKDAPMGDALRRLLDDVRAAVAVQPLAAPMLLRAVADGMGDYATAAKAVTDSVARGAVENAMAACTPRALASSIDAALYRFEHGAGGASPAERAWWDAFLVVAEDAGDVSAWLDVKGPRYVAWWRDVVHPAIAAPPSGWR
jgi:hypothetical protein